MTDKGGNKTEIQQLTKDQPNVGLGCRIAPDGSQAHESTYRLKKFKQLQAILNTTALTIEEMYQYLLTRIIPAVCYASALTKIPPKMCKKMNTCIDSVVMPKLGLNSHTQKAILYGPMMYGGLN